jgi:hypothetical protein
MPTLPPREACVSNRTSGPSSTASIGTQSEIAFSPVPEVNFRVYEAGSRGFRPAVRPAGDDRLALRATPAADAPRRGPPTSLQRMLARYLPCLGTTRPKSLDFSPTTTVLRRPAPTSGSLRRTTKRTRAVRAGRASLCTRTRRTLRPWRRPWLTETRRVRTPRRARPNSPLTFTPFRRARSLACSPARTRSRTTCERTTCAARGESTTRSPCFAEAP